MRASPNRRRVRTTALVERAGNKHGRRPISDHPRQKLQGHGVRSPSDIILKDGDLRKEERRRDETRRDERRGEKTSKKRRQRTAIERQKQAGEADFRHSERPMQRKPTKRHLNKILNIQRKQTNLALITNDTYCKIPAQQQNIRKNIAKRIAECKIISIFHSDSLHIGYFFLHLLPTYVERRRVLALL